MVNFIFNTLDFYCIILSISLVDLLKGFMLVEYESSDSAGQAKKIADGYIMDKNHIFRINLLTDVVEALGMSDEFEEQIPHMYPGEGQGSLWWWIMKDDAQDQFALLHQGEKFRTYMTH